MKAVFLLILLLGQLSWAQEALLESESKSIIKQEVEPSPSLEKISVVGSRIRRVDIEGPSPVTVLDREYLVKSGFDDLGSVLQQSSISSFGSDGVTVNVRGLGSDNTLILVNGNRLPKRGSAQAEPGSNINVIPLSAVDRVEILTDGASALYGSEALGAVINVVTRKNYDGLTFSSKISSDTPKGGEEVLLSGTYGKKFDKGFFDTSLQLRYITEQFRGDLNYLSDGFSTRRWYASDNYISGTDGVFYPYPSCTTLDDKGRCAQEYGDIAGDQSASLGSFSSLVYELTPELTFKADLLLRYGQIKSTAPGALDTINFEAGEAPASWGFLPGYTAGDSITLFHRGRYGNITFTEEQISYGGNFGLEGEWNIGGEFWSWSINNNIQTYEVKFGGENVALINETKAAMFAGRYDPFDVTKNDTTGMLGEVSSQDKFFLNMLEFFTEGSLGTLGGWDFSVATGAQLTYSEYKEDHSDEAKAGNVSGFFGESVKVGGNRVQSSAFFELASTYSHWFEAQLAARYDHYSDFGETINPKLALRIKPFKSLMFRSSLGTGFKAPSLQQLTAGQFSGFQFLFDPVTGSNEALPVISGGNADLKEETSFSYNFGVVAEPIEKLTFTLDYWNYEIKDIIGADIDGALELEGNGGTPGGITVVRDGITNEITSITALDSNLGTKRTDGFDLGANYNLITNYGRFNFNGNYSLVLNNEEAFYTELGFDSQLGEYGQPRWRYDLSIDYELPDSSFGFQILRRTSAHYLTQDETRQIPSHSQYDVNVRWMGHKALGGGDLRLGAVNVFDTQPDYDTSAALRFPTNLYIPFATYYIQYTTQLW